MAISSRPGLVRIDALTGDHASTLVRSLVAVFDAEDVCLDADTLEVHVLPRGDSSEAVVRVLDAVESWLSADGLESTRIHLDGRSYRVPAPRRTTQPS